MLKIDNSQSCTSDPIVLTAVKVSFSRIPGKNNARPTWRPQPEVPCVDLITPASVTEAAISDRARMMFAYNMEILGSCGVALVKAAVLLMML